MIRISVHENGPYLVRGQFALLDKDGRPFEVPERGVALCRCGHSADKPFCDGSHGRVGFRGPSIARAHDPLA